jgi:hypothetical protein
VVYIRLKIKTEKPVKMSDIARDLVSITENSFKRLEMLNEEETRRFPAPGKWSKKQILGHLIE